MLNYPDKDYQEWLARIDTTPPQAGLCSKPWHQPQQGVYFPFAQPRPGQLEAVAQVKQHTEQGWRVLLNAGTGFGKSPTMMALAANFGSAWVLVGKNDLVEQYRQDYEHLQYVGFLKAKTQFRCSLVPGQSCSEADAECAKRRKQCTAFINGKGDNVPPGIITAGQFTGNRAGAAKHVKQYLAERPCDYRRNRDFALAQNYTIMTVQMALTIFTYLKGFAPIRMRDLLIVDECSELESEILSFFDMTISTKTVFAALRSHKLFRPDSDDSIPMPKNLDEAKIWLEAVHTEVADLAIKMDENPDDYDRKQTKAISTLNRQIHGLKSGMDMGLPFAFDVEDTGFYGPSERGHHSYQIHIQPKEARGLYDKVFGDMARRHVFCSATTGTPQVWQNTHSMSVGVQYVEGGSPFPAENRPILYRPKGKLSRATFDNDIDDVIKDIIVLASQNGMDDPKLNHATQKGLIHTYTRKITDMVMEKLRHAGLGSRIVALQGSGKQRAEIMANFKKSDKPLILVSPSAMLGVSLDDDYGRWQIITKVPYAYLGDASVKHRKEVITGWYSWQTTKDVIQACGRVVRSPTDWGTTYILDSCFGSHLAYNGEQFPQWWHDAYSEWRDPVPAAPVPMGR